jgi:hypothetical protein
MQKHHKFNKNPHFSVPSLVYDLDFNRENASGWKPGQFDFAPALRDVYNKAIDLAKKHVKDLGDKNVTT